jgi:cell division protein FtsL
MTPAPARSHRRKHSRVAPGPRRISGPARPSQPVSRRMVAAPAGGAALPRPRRGTTGIFARVRALPEHRVVDRLLRSRLWIWALGALLGGIVAMQVSLLKLNSGISRAVETTTTLERQNAELEMSIARLSAPERVDEGAQALGMILPAAGEVSYLTAGPQDASRAVRRMEPPSDAAAALLANGGIEPGSLAASPVAPVVPADPTSTTTTTTTPTDPATATTTTPSTPTGTAEQAPVATPTPSVSQTPPSTTTQTSPAGGAVAGQG